jgi:hypothetical protein
MSTNDDNGRILPENLGFAGLAQPRRSTSQLREGIEPPIAAALFIVP